MLVSDAMPPVGGASRTFDLYGSTIAADGSCCRTADGVLAGTSLDMASAVRNCVRLLGVSLTSALRYASAEPARFLGLDDRLGHLAPVAAPTWWHSLPTTSPCSLLGVPA
jgi:N-acetylglucosamine-6-phosphate deacetylase